MGRSRARRCRSQWSRKTRTRRRRRTPRRRQTRRRRPRKPAASSTVRAMPELKRGEAKFILGCVQTFLEGFERDVAQVLRRELRGIEPPKVIELRQELSLLMRQLESRR